MIYGDFRDAGKPRAELKDEQLQERPQISLGKDNKKAEA